jgi:hypothetical protein
MTRKLEELFDFPPSQEELPSEDKISIEDTKSALAEIDDTIDKIDAALPAVKDLDASDNEMDDLAAKAVESYDNLMDLGMQVDSRYAAELFAVAGAMLGHALTAKTTKLNKKLKMIDLQLKKLKMDNDQARAAKNGDDPEVETAHGQILNRNDLLERLIAINKDQKAK